MDRNATGRMSCNPAIGGTAKGHLVREIDALGGVMGMLADKTGIQFKMLNKSKGPAVWSPRCQSDKEMYSLAATELISGIKNITFIEDVVENILVKEQAEHTPYKFMAYGVECLSKIVYSCKAVIISSGTFLNAVMHTGTQTTSGGRVDEKSSKGLSECLRKIGFETGRLKTGTPPRLNLNSIDFSKTEVQSGDVVPHPFSYRTLKSEFPCLKQVDCYLTHTNKLTHDILRTGFEDSPLFTGRIKGIGPRYCPSIEDKISRFSDKPRHQIFLEPETLNGNTVYMNGFSSSLTADIQLKAAKTVPGLENVKMIRPGYAVEYDFFPTYQIYPTLETKLVEGLYNAGQVNGTSGYEEAAAQGLIAGLNASLKILGKEQIILKRSDAYIGVLIDDLINKVPIEPYRMFTSSAEYRLVLRQDNADIRLTEIGYKAGLVDKNIYDALLSKIELVNNCVSFLKSNTISPKSVNSYLENNKSSLLLQNEFISNIIKRNEVNIKTLFDLNYFKDNNFGFNS